MNRARLYVRAVECDSGKWECHRGLEVVSVHASEEEAVGAAHDLAAPLAPSAVFVHREDGTVERVAVYDR